MAPGILGYLGFSGAPSSPPAEDQSPVRALPGSWYTSEDMYQLERRAIFSRRWLVTTHKNRLANIGDWMKYEVAGYEIILSHTRQGEIKAFHNVCRHRAYPVVEGKSGNAKIFSCRYHGWSYGLDGKLAKAPKYQDMQGFDKNQNNMFPVHVRVDTKGFIWINLDSREVPEIAWEDDFNGIDTQDRYDQYTFEDYVLDDDYTLEGDVNWKLSADNFNECYHCPTTHPDISTLADIEAYDVDAKFGWIKHQSVQDAMQKEAGLGISSTYFFPNTSISVLPHFMMIQTFVPQGPSHTTMRYQIWRNRRSDREKFDIMDQAYRRIMKEDKALCEGVQRNITTGVFINGELHPRWERGPLAFQKVHREVVREYYKKEKAAKKQLWPTRQLLPSSALVSKEDEEICTGLACQSASQEVLAW